MRIAPRTVALFPALTLLVVSLSCLAQEQERFRPAPRFEGTTISDPPRQNEPWTPPETSLPKFMTRASTTLFEQGLADPRGCDYRAIEISVGSVWSNTGQVVATHGWVLPETPGEKTRFAVTWSGLVYPTVSVGGPADLAADVDALVDAARALHEQREARPNAGAAGAFGGFGTNDEEFPNSLTGLHPIKVCLLLRIGRADLAEQVWAAATGRPRTKAGKVKVDLTNYGVSYLAMANDLAWYHFDRAVCAHMRGDDAVALADARMLTAFRKAVEAKAEALGFARPEKFNNRAKGDGPAPYIDFLGQLPELLADHERRAREPKRPPVPPPGGDKTARIAALIADLDQVFTAQLGQPGGVSLGESPTVKALIDEGDEAVEPLLEDLEQDVRLTRTVHIWRDFHRSRSILGAHEAAYTALCGLLKTSFFGAASTGDNLSARGLQGRKVVADRIRAYWQKNRDIPLVERWYRTLADDIAAPGEWLQAARNIVQHENVAVVPGSTAFTTTVTNPLPPGARPKLRGEALRTKQDPSVAELMAMRVKEIDTGGPLNPNSSDQFKAQSANQLAAMLAEWDSKAALPVLKARVDRCARVVQDGQKGGTRYHGMEAGIANLTNLRIKAGDPDALSDYAAWIRTVTPHHFDFPPHEMFEPLWRNPDHPAIRDAAAALFEDPRSPWNPSITLEPANADRGTRIQLLGSRLLGLNAFRTLVLRALADRTQVGTVETDAGGRVIVVQGNSRTVEDDDSKSVSVESSGGPSSQPERPFKPGKNALPLRMADTVCEALQQLPGIPRFQKQWPLAQRDAAIAACIAYLKQYGARFRENAASRAIDEVEPGGRARESALLAFDPLDQPATAADVAAGRAIFSVEGAGAEVRRFPLPSLPVAARWTKLKVFPNDPPIVRMYDKDGREYPNTEALQTGRVWQAEEVREGDRWRRYYGFVGRHALTRVADDEIELLTPWHEGWSLLSTDLDARIIIKGAATTGPVPFTVWFRNHHGVDTTAPTDLVRDAGGAPTVREGVRFKLIRESDKPDPPNPFAALEGAPEQPFPTEEIPALALRRHPGGASPQTLAPAGTISALQLDLRTLFRIDRPGRYRLEITFDDLKTDDGAPARVAAVFSVVAGAVD